MHMQVSGVNSELLAYFVDKQIPANNFLSLFFLDPFFDDLACGLLYCFKSIRKAH